MVDTKTKGPGQVQVFQLVVQFAPATGQLSLSLPQTDAMMQLAMLEMAKLQVTIGAVQQSLGLERSKIVTVPPGTKIQA